MKYLNYKNKEYKVNTLVKALGILLCVVILCLSFLTFYLNNNLNYHSVIGSSMRPLLNAKGDTDYVYVNPKIKTSRGEVGLFITKDNKLVVKRLIATGGEYVKVSLTESVYEGRNLYKIFVKSSEDANWEMIDDSYIYNPLLNENLYSDFYQANTNKEFVYINEEKVLYVPQGKVFYLGDNRMTSYDCADYGPGDESNEAGKVIFIIYGNYFRLWQVITQLLGFAKWS